VPWIDVADASCANKKSPKAALKFKPDDLESKRIIGQARSCDTGGNQGRQLGVSLSSDLEMWSVKYFCQPWRLFVAGQLEVVVAGSPFFIPSRAASPDRFYWAADTGGTGTNGYLCFGDICKRSACRLLCKDRAPNTAIKLPRLTHRQRQIRPIDTLSQSRPRAHSRNGD
jgi:hypothetical protein